MTLMEGLKVGIPALLLLAAIFGAYYDLDKAIDTKAVALQGQINLLTQVQDTTRLSVATHRGVHHDPNPLETQNKIRRAEEQLHVIDKRQAVIEQIVVDTQEDVSENRALLEDISRGIGEIRRNQ